MNKKIKMFSVFQAALMCAALMFLSSCSGTTPLKNRMVVQGIGVDAAESGFEVTVQTYKPGDAEKTSQEFELHRSSGATVGQALELIGETTGMQPMFSNTKVVIIGMDALSKGLGAVLDFFIRDERISADIAVLCTEGAAGELLSSESEGEKLSAQRIYDITKINKNNTGKAQGELLNVGARLYSDNCDAYVPLVEKSSDVNGESLKQTGIVMFDGQYASGALSEEQSRMFMWLDGLNASGIINTDYNGSQLVFRVNDIKTKNTLSAENGVPKAKINLDVRCELIEATPEQQDVFSEKDLSAVEQGISRQLNELAANTAEYAVRGCSCDIFRLGDRLKASHPNRFKELGNWKEALSRSIFDFEFVVRVQRMTK